MQNGVVNQPIDPCGQCVDYSRYAGRYNAKFYRNSEALQEIRYYRVPDDTPTLDTLHCFGHPNNDLTDDLPNPGDGQIGVLRKSTGYDNGRAPAIFLPNGDFCGEARQYLDGSDANVDENLNWTRFGFSTCCFDPLVHCFDGAFDVSFSMDYDRLRVVDC